MTELDGLGTVVMHILIKRLKQACDLRRHQGFDRHRAQLELLDAVARVLFDDAPDGRQLHHPRDQGKHEIGCGMRMRFSQATDDALHFPRRDLAELSMGKVLHQMLDSMQVILVRALGQL